MAAHEYIRSHFKDAAKLGHLSQKHQDVAESFAALADELAALPDTRERNHALHLLLATQQAMLVVVDPAVSAHDLRLSVPVLRPQPGSGYDPPREPTGLLCTVCQEPQSDSPTGGVCKNGHEGAHGYRPPVPAVVDLSGNGRDLVDIGR